MTQETRRDRAIECTKKTFEDIAEERRRSYEHRQHLHDLFYPIFEGANRIQNNYRS